MKLLSIISAIALAPVAVQHGVIPAAMCFVMVLVIGTLLPDRPSRRMSQQAVSAAEVRRHPPARPSHRASLIYRPSRGGSHNHGSAI